MSDTKFTPGPWVAGWNDGKTGPTTPSGEETCGDMEVMPVGYGTETVAIVVDQCHMHGKGGALKANAHLISAAPDMYEALQQAVTSMQDNGYPNKHLAVRAARRALKKARGEV